MRYTRYIYIYINTKIRQVTVVDISSFTFFTVFISFNKENETVWSDLKALERYYKFPEEFIIIDQWLELVDTFSKLSIVDKSYRSLSLCALRPDAILTVETDDKVLELLKIDIYSQIDNLTNQENGKETLNNSIELELEIRNQWFNQKPLHRLFIENQLNKLVNKIVED